MYDLNTHSYKLLISTTPCAVILLCFCKETESPFFSFSCVIAASSERVVSWM